MVKLTIYIEGGGDGRDLERRFRRGWGKFLAATGVGRRPKIVRGGARAQTFKRFATAVAGDGADRLPILLVDSEAAVDEGQTVWGHLAANDGWKRPAGANEGAAFLMVQFMETWLLADREALRTYFGHEFKEKAIPRWPNLEAVSKKDAMRALDRATAACSRPYAKGRVSFELLAATDPARVESACPRAKDLFDRLRAILP